MNARQLTTLYATLSVGFLTAVFVYYYVAREDPAYLWDWGAYFKFYKDFGAYFLSNRHFWLQRLVVGIGVDDYNASPVILLTPFFLIFGASRTGFIFGIVLVYLIPAALLAAKLVLKAMETNSESDLDTGLTFGVVCFSALFFHQFWAPTLRGMPDIVGLVPLGLATILVTREAFLRRVPFRTALAVGLLLWLSFLLRRWYAYAAVGLMSAAALVTFVLVLRARQPWRTLVRAAASYAVMATAIILCVVLFQLDLARNILTTSYADLYAGYQQPFLAQLNELLARSGIILAVLFVSGALIGAVKNNIIVIFCTLAAIITFVVFSTTQSPGLHHTLPVFFWIFVVAYYTIVIALNTLHGAAKGAAAILACVYSIITFASVYAPEARTALQGVAFALPKQTVFPLRLENFSEYQRLINALHALPIARHDLSLFGSSELFSDALLVAIDDDLRPLINEASQVDSRDHMRISTLRSNYVVVADPVPIHLSAAAQHVVTVPARSIIDRTQFGAGYEKIAGPFSLADGMSANIYKRTRPLGDDDIAWMQMELNKTYPTWKVDGNDMIE